MDKVKQLNGKTYSIISEHARLLRVISDTNEELKVPKYVYENGLVTKGIEEFCRTGNPKYLIDETLELNNGVICRVAQVLGNYAKIAINGKEEWCIIWYLLAKGEITRATKHKNSIVGTEVLQNCGMVAKCIEHLTRDRIVVQFEDGSARECDRKNFKRGLVKCKNNQKDTLVKVGDVYTNKNNYKVLVRKQTSGGSFLCVYEDGVVAKFYPNDLIEGTFTRESEGGTVYFSPLKGEYTVNEDVL